MISGGAPTNGRASAGVLQDDSNNIDKVLPYDCNDANIDMCIIINNDFDAVFNVYLFKVTRNKSPDETYACLNRKAPSFTK